MTSPNLAIIFAPNLLRCRSESVQQIMRDSPHVQSVVRCMIDDYPELFGVMTYFYCAYLLIGFVCIARRSRRVSGRSIRSRGAARSGTRMTCRFPRRTLCPLPPPLSRRPQVSLSLCPAVDPSEASVLAPAEIVFDVLLEAAKADGKDSKAADAKSSQSQAQPQPQPQEQKHTQPTPVEPVRTIEPLPLTSAPIHPHAPLTPSAPLTPTASDSDHSTPSTPSLSPRSSLDAARRRSVEEARLKLPLDQLSGESSADVKYFTEKLFLLQTQLSNAASVSQTLSIARVVSLCIKVRYWPFTISRAREMRHMYSPFLLADVLQAVENRMVHISNELLIQRSKASTGREENRAQLLALTQVSSSHICDNTCSTLCSSVDVQVSNGRCAGVAAASSAAAEQAAQADAGIEYLLSGTHSRTQSRQAGPFSLSVCLSIHPSIPISISLFSPFPSSCVCCMCLTHV
jgi:hypothetical protein